LPLRSKEEPPRTGRFRWGPNENPLPRQSDGLE
jgi:hypothetical protein